MPLRWLVRSAYVVARRWYVWRRPTRHTAVVALWVEGRVLTVSHSYKEGRSLPGGGLRRGEPPDRGAARELREETGVCIDPADLNLVDIVETDGRYGRRISWIYEIGLSALPRLRCNGWETVSAQLSEPSGVPLPRSVSLPPPRAVA